MDPYTWDGRIAIFLFALPEQILFLPSFMEKVKAEELLSLLSST